MSVRMSVGIKNIFKQETIRENNLGFAKNKKEFIHKHIVLVGLK